MMAENMHGSYTYSHDSSWLSSLLLPDTSQYLMATVYWALAVCQTLPVLSDSQLSSVNVTGCPSQPCRFHIRDEGWEVLK